MRMSYRVSYDIADGKRLKKVFKAICSYGIGVAQGSLYNPAAVRDLLFFSLRMGRRLRGEENAGLEPSRRYARGEPVRAQRTWKGRRVKHRTLRYKGHKRNHRDTEVLSKRRILNGECWNKRPRSNLRHGAPLHFIIHNYS